MIKTVTPGLQIKSLEINHPSIKTYEGTIDGPVEYTVNISLGNDTMAIGVSQESYENIQGYYSGVL